MSRAKMASYLGPLSVACFLASCQLARAEVPISLGSDYQEAQELLSRRKWAEAAVVLRKVLKSAPEFASGALDLAKALVYSGRREEALSVLTEAANRERGQRRAILVRRVRVLSRLFLSNTTFQMFQEGFNLLLARKYGAARDRFERALAQEPDNVEVLTRVGQCLVMDGDYDSAAERLRLARKLSPHEPEVRLWLGRALHQRGELNEAVDELRLAASGLEGSELAPVWLAEALTSAGQRAAALQTLEQDLKAQPYHVLALFTAARLRFQATDGAVTPSAAGAQALWAVRRDLQLALSRLPRYSSAELPRFEGELGLDLRDSGGLKKDIDGLLKRVDSRLETEEI
jgi:tetratricopeptide (TPR) repeat protein